MIASASIPEFERKDDQMRQEIQARSVYSPVYKSCAVDIRMP